MRPEMGHAGGSFEAEVSRCSRTAYQPPPGRPPPGPRPVPLPGTSSTAPGLHTPPSVPYNQLVTGRTMTNCRGIW